MNSEILIKIDNYIGEEALSEVCTDLRCAGVKVNTKVENRSGPFGSLDWLIPTAIGVYLMKPYVDGFLTKAGEDHYEALINVIVNKIWPRIFGENKDWHREMVTMSGQIKENAFSSSFSLSQPLTMGGIKFEVRLIFRKNSDKASMGDAIHKFLELIESHRKNDTLEDFAKKLYELDGKKQWTKPVWLNPSTGKIEYLDAIQSSKQGKLISHPIQ